MADLGTPLFATGNNVLFVWDPVILVALSAAIGVVDMSWWADLLSTRGPFCILFRWVPFFENFWALSRVDRCAIRFPVSSLSTLAGFTFCANLVSDAFPKVPLDPVLSSFTGQLLETSRDFFAPPPDLVSRAAPAEEKPSELDSGAARLRGLSYSRLSICSVVEGCSPDSPLLSLIRAWESASFLLSVGVVVSSKVDGNAGRLFVAIGFSSSRESKASGLRDGLTSAFCVLLKAVLKTTVCLGSWFIVERRPLFSSGLSL